MTQGQPVNDTAIVIVTYNSALEIGQCLEAAIPTGARILVIDNASQDHTVSVVGKYPVQLIANESNRGFAGAVNQGVRESEADYVLLLNPDAVLRGGIERLRTLCMEPSVGAAAGLLVGGDGKPQAGFTVRKLPTPVSLSFEVLGLNRVFPRNPVNWRFRCFNLRLDGKEPISVEQPAGALLMFRRADWETIGGFDERFHPLWFEDVDFCARLKHHGRVILLAPEVLARHTGSHSILNMAREIRHYYWYGNLLRYASKHFSPLNRKLVCASVIAGAGIRYFGDVLNGHNTGKQSGNRQTGVWKQVARLAVRSFSGEPI